MYLQLYGSGKCKTSLKTNTGSLIGQKRANNASYQAPASLPRALPTPTPSQKQKHVTSGSMCLRPPAGREDSQPPETTSVTSSPALRSCNAGAHTHTGTFSNSSKYQEVGSSVLLLKMKYILKYTIFKEHLTNTVH